MVDPTTAAVAAVGGVILSNKELMVHIYKDLASPGVQQVGKAIGTVLQLCNTALLPIRYGNEVAEAIFVRNMQKYRERIGAIPINQISEVPPEIGVPILERLTYTTNEILSDMFIELLTAASEQRDANAAHPAFISIIANLAPDEALLLKAMDTLSIKLYGNGGFAFHQKNVDHVLQPSYYMLDPMYVDRANLAFPENIGAYIINLDRLGLIKADHMIQGKLIASMEARDGPPEHNPIARIKERYEKVLTSQSIYTPQHMYVHWWFGDVVYTEFGRFFRHACVERVWRPPDDEGQNTSVDIVG